MVVPILFKSAEVAELADAIRRSVRQSQTLDRARVPTTGTIFFSFRFSFRIFPSILEVTALLQNVRTVFVLQ